MTYKSLISLLMILLVAAGCGGGSSYTPPPPVISVAVTPTAANVHVTNTKQFTATVQNATNSTVNWSVSGTGCTGTACGSISSTGLYTAPTGVPTPDSVTVTATSVADTSKSDTATVSVLAAVIVTVSPANPPNITIGATQSFTATVQNAIDSTVNWSLSGPGCSGSTCGTITSGGMYTAPSVVPSPPGVTITATSVEDTAKSNVANATLVSSVAIMSWPSATQVTAAATRQLGLLVTGTTNTAVNWQVTGQGCSGNTCGTVSSTGVYNAPRTVPNPDTVTITATSQVDLGKSAISTVKIVPFENAKLSGTYGFLYQGFSLNAPAQVAGTLVADGQGNITIGVFDRTWPASAGGNLLNQNFTGTYSVTPDNRGTMTWTGTWGTVEFSFAINGNGDKAFLQTFYDSNTRMTGTMFKQDTSAFANSAVQGDYVLQLCGTDDTGDRVASLGTLHADGSGHITAGNLDINDGSSILSNLSFTGTYSVHSNSRGTLSLTISSLGTFNYSIYVIAADRFLVTSTDTISTNASMLSGPARKQSGGPFSLASLSGTSVFEMHGTPSSTAAQVDVGLLTSDANGHITGVYDENKNNGANYTANTAFTATYTMASNGRGTLTSSTIPDGIFYLVSPNVGLFLQEPAGAVLAGSFEPQTAITYSNATLIGPFSFGIVSQLLNNIISTTGVTYYDGAGYFTATEDDNAPSIGLMGSGQGGGTYVVGANGRAYFAPNGGGSAVSYMVAPTRNVEILGPYPSNIPPDDRTMLSFVEQ
jgi:hypothetical protein